jgi:L-lactate dehydrogenase complex protein LldE
MRVALFVACFNGTLFPSVGRAVVEVLERLGHQVDFPLEQTCCGQMHFNTGYRPLRLLRAVRGLELVELPAAEECCGFGGTFALKNADVSAAMLADKMRHVLDTGAEVCTAGDTSCLMHIGGGLSRGRTGVKTVHLAEILASRQKAAGPATAAEAGSVAGARA